MDLAAARPWLDNMLDACAVYEVVREEGRIVDFIALYLNPVAARDLHIHAGSAAGRSITDIEPSVTSEGLFLHFAGVVDTGSPWTGTAVDTLADNGTLIREIRAWKAEERLAVTWRDVTERERATAALKLSEQRLRTTADQLPDAVSVFQSVRDADGEIIDFRWVYANASGARLTGRSVQQLLGATLREITAGAEDPMMPIYTQVVATGNRYEQPTVWRDSSVSDEGRRAYDVRASRVGDGFVLVTRDVTDLRLATEYLQRQERELQAANAEAASLNATLRDLVLRDPLTGLLNRRYLDERLAGVVDSHDIATDISLLQIDIDHFKSINDTYGHDVGDRVIVGVASLLKESFRSVDFACRYGGEEFTVVMPGCGLATAVDRAENLRLRIAESTPLREILSSPLTVSVGVASLRTPAGSGLDLLHAADQALLTAKSSGRNRVSIGSLALSGAEA